MSIKVGSRYFACLDLVWGYFQCELAPESRAPTTFLLTQGRFQYARAPMGLNASGDHFCKMSDLALGELAKAKIVDDVMVEGCDVNDIYMCA